MPQNNKQYLSFDEGDGRQHWSQCVVTKWAFIILFFTANYMHNYTILILCFQDWGMEEAKEVAKEKEEEEDEDDGERLRLITGTSTADSQSLPIMQWEDLSQRIAELEQQEQERSERSKVSYGSYFSKHFTSTRLCSISAKCSIPSCAHPGLNSSHTKALTLFEDDSTCPFLAFDDLTLRKKSEDYFSQKF